MLLVSVEGLGLPVVGYCSSGTKSGSVSMTRSAFLIVAGVVPFGRLIGSSLWFRTPSLF